MNAVSQFMSDNEPVYSRKTYSVNSDQNLDEEFSDSENNGTSQSIEDPASYWFDMGNESATGMNTLNRSPWTLEEIEVCRKRIKDDLEWKTVHHSAPSEHSDDESSEQSENIPDTDSMPSLDTNSDSDDDDMPDLIDTSPLYFSQVMAMSSNVEESSASQSDSDSCQDEEVSQECLMSGKLGSLLSIPRCCIISSGSESNRSRKERSKTNVLVVWLIYFQLSELHSELILIESTLH